MEGEVIQYPNSARIFFFPVRYLKAISKIHNYHIPACEPLPSPGSCWSAVPVVPGVLPCALHALRASPQILGQSPFFLWVTALGQAGVSVSLVEEGS